MENLSICYDRELNVTRCWYIKNEEKVHGKLKLEIACDGQRYCNQQTVSLIKDIWIINEDVTVRHDPFKVDIKKEQFLLLK
ncbi:MAG: hypothetical protein QW228_09975 [Candidatus Aenigmatarchaeota archaeon]